MRQKTQAVTLLRHYLDFGMTAAGNRWDSDNTSEVEELVDCIVNAAAAEMKEELDQLRAEIKDLRDGLSAIGSHPSMI